MSAPGRVRGAGVPHGADFLVIIGLRPSTLRPCRARFLPMDDLLSLTSSLPERRFEPGEVVVREGEGATGAAVWVLVSGVLEVRKGDVAVNTVTQPGALIGEVAVLLQRPYGATVVATAPSVLRQAADGSAFIASHPAIARQVAVGLAERLNFVTSYLADLKHQYGDAPGLAMVDEVLREIALRRGPRARPGSAREPDPDPTV